MSRNVELVARARAVLYPNYKPQPISFERGSGCILVDADGHEVLDMASGVAVCSVGHSHPKLAAALAEQLRTLVHVSNYVYNTVNIELAEALVEKSGLDRALFCNSGGEANEALLKLARYHFHAKGEPRARVIAFDNAFHGRTLGALSMTGTKKYREGFGDLGPVTHVPYGDLEATRAALQNPHGGPSDVAAIIVECVQGEGGVLPAPDGFLPGLRALCTEYGALFFVDEVQTGIGRLGTWFGYQKYDVKPDAISVAKGLGGGVPIGAMLTTEALAASLPAGMHGTTFGGNPLACRAGLTVLAILEEENLVSGAEAKGALLHELLLGVVSRHPEVCEGARGVGLLRGLVLKAGFPARDCLGPAMDAGVMLTAAGDRVIRFTPPLIVTEAQLRTAVERVEHVVAALEAKTRAA